MRLRRSILTLSLSLLIAFLSDGQINADFTANSRSGCGSFQVSFTDLSTSTAGPIVSWSWNLGDVHSSRQNPGRIFGSPGKYKICLEVTDSQGNSDTHCEEDYIVVYHLPSPAFEVNFKEGCSPLMVNFSDQSNGEDSPIKEWIWGMGGVNGVLLEDGSRPMIPNIYTTPDDYTVSLTVIDENGCLNTLTKNHYIKVHDDPIIDFSVDQNFACEAPLEVVFTNHIVDAGIQYQWDFGNGETFVGGTPPQISYRLPGNYSVKVKASNKQTDCKTEETHQDYIRVGYATEVAISETQGCAPFEVTFSDQSVASADSVLWDFGNGTFSRETHPIQLYDKGGCYPVQLTRYVNGCEIIQTMNECIQVDTIATPDYFSTARIACEIPHIVDFTSATLNAVEWFWDFGDGASSQLANPSHTYTRFGEFPVTLRVIDANGCMASMVKDTIRVAPLIADIAKDVFRGCTPLEVSLEDRSSSIVPIVSWEWEVSDASLPPKLQYSSDTIPHFTLVDTGKYTIRLIVENQLGCIDSSWFTEQIGVGVKPLANFSADPNVSCIGTVFSFSDESSAFADEWLWDFGDGSLSSEQYPEHVYGNVGLFDVSLKASHYECEDEIIFQDYITVQAPKAQFKIERDCDRPYEVRLKDESVGADSLIYYFGVPNTQSDTSTQRNPVFSFSETGTYTISQTVFNLTNGCMDSSFIEVIITDPKAQFSIQESSGCAPLELSFHDESKFGLQYLWTADFGTWDDSTSLNPKLTITQAGEYVGIALNVMDVNQCVDRIVVMDTIKVNQAKADFTILPANGCLPLAVAFEDQSTSLFSNITEWQWNFGYEGSSSSSPSPSYTFDTIGIFNISLEVKDAWGCTDQLLISNGVEVTFPIADFSADTLGCTSNSVDLLNFSSGDHLRYLWDFGDGTTSVAESPSHLYSSEGVYTICLTVTNDFGCDSTLCKNDYIRIANPQASFSLDTAFASCPPLIVHFQNNSLNTSNYSWNFGDSSGQSNNMNPAHVYTAPGLYDVSLIAKGFGGCQDTLNLEDLIHVEGPVGEFSFDVDSSCVPATITFFGSGLEQYDFIWDLGDGHLDSSLQVTSDTLVYTYEEAGILSPQLILVNAENCQRIISAEDTLFFASLEADFGKPPMDYCGSTTIPFVNLTQSSVGIQSVHWFFPEASPSETDMIEPLITFETPGFYDVGLIVDNGFCQDTLYRQDYIEIGEEVAVTFQMSDDTACALSTILFNGLSFPNSSAIAEWSWDFGDGKQSELQSPEHYFEEAGSYLVKLKIKSTAGCLDSTTQTIFVKPVPSLEDQEYPAICQGETLSLDLHHLFDTTVLKWEWAYHPDLSCIDCLAPVVQPLVSTCYYLILENEEACRDTVVFQVKVKPYAIPDIYLDADTLICLYDSILLHTRGGLPEYSYEWKTSASDLNCYDCATPIARPVSNTLYHLTVSTTEGCQKQDSIYVEVIDQSHPFAGPDRTICAGDTVLLEIKEGAEPQWLNGEGLSCTDCFDPMASPLETQDYPVQIRTATLGCRIFDTVRVTIIQEDEVSAGPDTTLCLGESYILKGRGEGSVQWLPDFGLDQNDILEPEAGPISSTTYILSVQNGDCLLTDSVNIQVNDKVQIWGRDTAICQGTAVQLFVEGDALTYHWEPEELISQQGFSNPVVYPEEPVTYTAIGYNSICEPDTATITVDIKPLPQFKLPPRHYFFRGELIQLFPVIADPLNLQYQWSPSLGLSCTDCTEPIVELDTTSVYQLKLENTETGCADSISTTVQQLFACPQDLINVPNIFTPNEDGINDVLALHPSRVIQSILTFKIFNRWGELVFETNDLYAKWDGSFKGELLPSGVYVYYLEAICPISKYNFIKAGDITLINK